MFKGWGVYAGVAGSIALGLVCLPASLALAAATVVFLAVTDDGSFSDGASGTAVANTGAFAETLPTGCKGFGNQIQARMCEITWSEAHELALQAAAPHKDAKIELSYRGDKVAWSVYTRGGRLIEHGEIDIPLR